MLTSIGRDKATAAFGHGILASVIQFIKGKKYMLQQYGVEFQAMATGFIWEKQNMAADIAAC